MDDDAIQRLLHRVAEVAPLVGGTEAYAAEVLEADRVPPSLRRLVHIRPGNAPEEKREIARKAFEEVIEPWLTAGKDGAIEVGVASDGEDQPQFCIVRLLRSQAGKVFAVVAIITRCESLIEARAKLVAIQQFL